MSAAAPAAVQRSGTLFDRGAPILFVFIWATGFIVARLVAPHCDPLTFLAIRFVISSAVFGAMAVVTGALWPSSGRAWFTAVTTGVLMQGVYLGGVFWAAKHGMPASISALITGLQPLLTAALAFPLLGEVVSVRRWAGIALGALGAALVLLPAVLAVSGAATVGIVAIGACLIAMLSITGGTLIQKAMGGAQDIRTGACVQFGSAAVVTTVAALATEPGRFDGSWQAWVGLGWAVAALSIGAATILLLLLRRGAVAGVASLFFLVPPVVAVMAFVGFGEQLGLVQMAGVALAALGVGLATRG